MLKLSVSRPPPAGPPVHFLFLSAVLAWDPSVLSLHDALPILECFHSSSTARSQAGHRCIRKERAECAPQLASTASELPSRHAAFFRLLQTSKGVLGLGPLSELPRVLLGPPANRLANIATLCWA